MSHNVAVDRFAVDGDGADSAADAVGVADSDFVFGSAELAGDVQALPCRRDARIDFQALVFGLDAEDELRDGVVVPSGGAGQPAVLGLAGLEGVLAGNHLRVDVGLNLVELAAVFGV